MELTGSTKDWIRNFQKVEGRKARFNWVNKHPRQTVWMLENLITIIENCKDFEDEK